jgi:hypothetical protein
MKARRTIARDDDLELSISNGRDVVLLVLWELVSCVGGLEDCERRFFWLISY